MRTLSFFLLTFFYCVVSNAQRNGQLVEQSLDIKIPFTITEYSTKDGLPQSQILSIIPKVNGSLIIATANGIVEYNGVEFKPFIPYDNYKNRIYVKLYWHEKSGKLFGTDLGGSGFLLYPKYLPIINGNHLTLEKDSLYSINKNGEIFSASVYDLAFKKIINTNIKTPISFDYNYPNVYISSNEGLFSFNIKSTLTTKLNNDHCVRFKQNKYDKATYAICNRNIFKINDTSVVQIIDYRTKNRDIVFNDIDFINETEYFVASNMGLFEINPEYTDLYTKKSALPSQYIQSLYYSKDENCLFVGTGEKGLLRLQLKNCYSFSYHQGFGEASSLSSIIKTKNGDVLVGETLGNLYKIGMDTVYSYSELKNSYASLAEIDGIIFAGTWGDGVKLLQDKKQVGTISTPIQLPNNFVHCSFKDSHGIIWIGTSNGVSNGKTINSIRPCFTNIIKNDIITFYELKDGTVCIGGSEGANLINKNGEITCHIGRKEGLTGKEVRSFYEDQQGKLWIGTYDGGLYCYYKNKLTSINRLKNAKLDDDAFCLAKDNTGYIYMTSNHGLWCVKEKDLSDFYEGKLEYLIPFHYTEEAGILNTEFNGGFQNNYLKTKMNHFYFPSLQGIVIVTPEEQTFRKLNPIIDRILVNDTLSALTNPSLDRSTYSLQFDFSCVNFVDKYNVYYQYKLETNSQTQQWSPLQKKGSISFKLLPPDKYTLTIRALDAFNDKTPAELKIKFEIKPYFYETVWFYCIVFLLFMIAVTLFVRMRINTNKKKAEEQERVKRELAELELKAVQAQMNPHFIFNSLNSIKHYLYINDAKSADIFIDNFSILLRDFLDYSSQNFITIEKKVEMLHSYLNLEKMRMNPPFNFSITLPEHLKQIKIPTLITQPFVENAVKHGIRHSEKSCTLNITFEEDNGNIICKVEDDGIGRKRSNEINHQKKYHISKGISLVNEKIKILKEISHIDVSIKTEDKLSASKESIGTLVIITIPIKEHD